MSYWVWSSQATGLRQKLRSNEIVELGFFSTPNKNHCGVCFFSSLFVLTSLHLRMINGGSCLVFSIHYLRCFLSYSISSRLARSHTEHWEKYNSILTYSYSSYFFASFCLWHCFKSVWKGKSVRQLQCGYTLKVRYHWLEWDNYMRFFSFVSSCDNMNCFDNFLCEMRALPSAYHF